MHSKHWKLDTFQAPPGYPINWFRCTWQDLGTCAWNSISGEDSVYHCLLTMTAYDLANEISVGMNNPILIQYNTFLWALLESPYSFRRAMWVDWYLTTKSSSLVSLFDPNQTCFKSHWLFSIMPWVLLSFVIFWKNKSHKHIV